MVLGGFRSINDAFKDRTAQGVQQLYFNRLRRIRLSPFFDTDEQIHLGLQTYQRTTDGDFATNDERTYYRILNLKNIQSGVAIKDQPQNILYDSYSKPNNNNYFPRRFFFTMMSPPI